MPERVYTNRYEIVRHLARGGMAEVYLAHDQLLDRRVALKVLFPEFARDPLFVQRFRREAQAAANLNHPNIVAVFDWGEEDGTYFIVMEYVEGRSLREAIQADGPLYPNLAADLAGDIAGALGFAHRSGVVHRDVKPGNILLTPQGQVKVTDFGIARAAGASEGLTQAGSVMGTATYFSPEQAQGLPVDARSDVYSLGVVLYEMVCGIPPFTGESPISVAYKHVREHPTHPTVVNPDVPAGLENIILTAMSKSPEGRYDSADDMRADLARFRRGEATTSVPLAAVPVTGSDVTVVNPRMDTVYDRTTVGTVVPSPTLPVAPRRSPAPFVLALIALLAVLAGLGYLLAKQLSGGGGNTLVAVDNYVGQPVHDAELLIENAGLKPDSATEENDQVPAGQVFAQDPVAGTKIEKGDTVHLKVSAGKGQVKVPDVSGQSLDDAQSRLSDAGFEYRVQQETSDSIDAGKVTRTDPPGGSQADKGTVVKLFVSAGKEQVQIPDVSGQDPVTAANTLGAKDLTAEQVNQPSDTVDDGKVIGTNPPAGTSVYKGSKVQLIISSGKEQVRVPNVVGLSKSDATTELQNAGFQVIVREVTSLDPNNAGRVIAQSPSADAKAAKGSAVTISVGKFAGGGSTTTTTTFPVMPGVAAPIAAWYAHHGRHDLPWRATRDRWAVLVSEVMLQQTPVGRVAAVWSRFMARFPTPEAMAAAAPGEVIAAWGTLGYPRRARRLWEAAGRITAAGWPEDLSDLPGVGHYTAGAVAAQVDGIDAPAVETNIRRVVERRAGRVLSPSEAGVASREAGHPLTGRDRLLALMDIGAVLCRPRSPRCPECPLSPACATAASGDPARFGAPLGRRPRQAAYEGSFRQRRGRVLAVLRDGPHPAADLDPGALSTLIEDGLATLDGPLACLP